MTKLKRFYIILGAIVVAIVLMVIFVPQQKIDDLSTPLTCTVIPAVAWLIFQIGKEEDNKKPTS